MIRIDKEKRTITVDDVIITSPRCKCGSCELICVTDEDGNHDLYVDNTPYESALVNLVWELLK